MAEVENWVEIKFSPDISKFSVVPGVLALHCQVEGDELKVQECSELVESDPVDAEFYDSIDPFGLSKLVASAVLRFRLFGPRTMWCATSCRTSFRMRNGEGGLGSSMRRREGWRSRKSGLWLCSSTGSARTCFWSPPLSLWGHVCRASTNGWPYS